MKIGRKRAFAAWCLTTACLCLVSVPRAEAATQSELDAARNRGLAWLLTRQSGDGSWRGAIGSELAATATALEALSSAGIKGYPAAGAVAWLSNTTPSSVDSLARKVLALKGTGANVTPFLQTLVAWRNTTRGWGAYDHFETSFPDTPLALAAIRTAGYSYADYGFSICEMVEGFDEMAQGTLRVVSERFPCPSCQSVAEQFSRALPGIELELLPRGVTVTEAIAGGVGGQVVEQAIGQGATYFNNSLNLGGTGQQTMQGVSPR